MPEERVTELVDWIGRRVPEGQQLSLQLVVARDSVVQVIFETAVSRTESKPAEATVSLLAALLAGELCRVRENRLRQAIVVELDDAATAEQLNEAQRQGRAVMFVPRGVIVEGAELAGGGEQTRLDLGAGGETAAG